MVKLIESWLWRCALVNKLISEEMAEQLRNLNISTSQVDGLLIDPLGDGLDGIDNWQVIFKRMKIAKIYYRIELSKSPDKQGLYEPIWTAKLDVNLFRVMKHCSIEIPNTLEKDSIKHLCNAIINIWLDEIDKLLEIRDEEYCLLDEIPF